MGSDSRGQPSTIARKHGDERGRRMMATRTPPTHSLPRLLKKKFAETPLLECDVGTSPSRLSDWRKFRIVLLRHGAMSEKQTIAGEVSAGGVKISSGRVHYRGLGRSAASSKWTVRRKRADEDRPVKGWIRTLADPPPFPSRFAGSLNDPYPEPASCGP